MSPGQCCSGAAARTPSLSAAGSKGGRSDERKHSKQKFYYPLIEIRSLWSDYEIKVITYRKSERPRAHAFPHEIVEYKDSCLVYGPIEKAKPEFEDLSQRSFVQGL
jgi:hypothetical protein